MEKIAVDYLLIIRVFCKIYTFVMSHVILNFDFFLIVYWVFIDYYLYFINYVVLNDIKITFSVCWLTYMNMSFGNSKILELPAYE